MCWHKKIRCLFEVRRFTVTPTLGKVKIATVSKTQDRKVEPSFVHE